MHRHYPFNMLRTLQRIYVRNVIFFLVKAPREKIETLNGFPRLWDGLQIRNFALQQIVAITLNQYCFEYEIHKWLGGRDHSGSVRHSITFISI